MNTYTCLFSWVECFPDYTFYYYDRHRNLRTSLLWVLRKKSTFACTIFSKICYVAWEINCAGKLRHEHNHVGLNNKPGLHHGVLKLLNLPTSGLYPLLGLTPHCSSIHKPPSRCKTMTFEKIRIVRLLKNG